MNDFESFGPLVGHLLVTQELIGYTTGILSGRNYVYEEVTENIKSHSATIVGYGMTINYKPFWIMRNNWGPGFGEDGIFRIDMDLVIGVYSLRVHADELVAVPRRSERIRVR